MVEASHASALIFSAPSNWPLRKLLVGSMPAALVILRVSGVPYCILALPTGLSESFAILS